MAKEVSVPALFQMGYFWEAKTFLTSVCLDVYTPLADGGKTAKEIAQAVGADVSALERLLDALVAMGVLKKEEDRFINSPAVQEFLVKGSPFYSAELMLLQDDEWGNWGHLEELIRTGKPIVHENVFMNRPEVGAKILRVLHRMALRNAPSIAKAVDLSDCKSLLDVGGGAGTFSIFFCKANPDLAVTLFDLPGSLGVAEKNIAKFGMEGRIRLVSGNFKSDPLPGPFDAIFLSDILHYQTFEENQLLFDKLYSALAPNGKVIVKDMFINDDPANPGWNAIFSIHLMVYSEKGRCFRVRDLYEWLQRSGFKESRELERSMLLIARKMESP